MSMISEQVKRLRDMAVEYSESICLDLHMALKDAADTIEELSAKLSEANMERSSAYYNGGWIPCSERLPQGLVPVNITWVNRNPETYYSNIKDVPFTATGIFYNGKWWWYSVVCKDYLAEYGESKMDSVDKDIEVIAWMPLPPVFKGD